jgi:hypothetical protein
MKTDEGGDYRDKYKGTTLIKQIKIDFRLPKINKINIPLYIPY